MSHRKQDVDLDDEDQFVDEQVAQDSGIIEQQTQVKVGEVRALLGR